MKIRYFELNPYFKWNKPINISFEDKIENITKETVSISCKSLYMSRPHKTILNGVKGLKLDIGRKIGLIERHSLNYKEDRWIAFSQHTYTILQLYSNSNIDVVGINLKGLDKLKFKIIICDNKVILMHDLMVQLKLLGNNIKKLNAIIDSDMFENATVVFHEEICKKQ